MIGLAPRNGREDTMHVGRCRCGVDDAGGPRFGCLTCAEACCSACAITLESVAYCRHCAAMLLGVAVIRMSGPFELC